MSLPRYPDYKPSGVEWLGEVPGHWDVWKLSHAFDVIGSGTTPKSDNTAYYDDGQTAWVNTGDLNDGELFDCEKRVTDLALAEHSSLKTFPAGSLVIAMYGATIGKLAILHFPSTVNQACCVFVGGARVQSMFLFYWFLGLRQQIISLATGGGQPNISQEILRGLRLACPLLEEQQAIATFLDRETGKIDSLIAEQRRLVELLVEKRQAVISHAATKGLNPDAPMKDSGVEWLGEVPEHWDVKRLKFLCDVQTGDKDTVNSIDDGEYPFFVRSQTIEKINSFTFDCEAVLTAGDGVGVGKVYHYVNGKFDFHQRVYMMNNFRGVTGKFFFRYLAATFHKVALDGGAKSTVDSLRMPLFMNFEITVPPAEEQSKIIAFLDNETAKFDTLTSEVNRAIALLQERRSALISSAVTGKIDVRHSLQ